MSDKLTAEDYALIRQMCDAAVRATGLAQVEKFKSLDAKCIAAMQALEKNGATVLHAPPKGKPTPRASAN